jgi:hypothetical protein
MGVKSEAVKKGGEVCQNTVRFAFNVTLPAVFTSNSVHFHALAISKELRGQWSDAATAFQKKII